MREAVFYPIFNLGEDVSSLLFHIGVEVNLTRPKLVKVRVQSGSS